MKKINNNYNNNKEKIKNERSNKLVKIMEWIFTVIVQLHTYRHIQVFFFTHEYFLGQKI